MLSTIAFAFGIAFIAPMAMGMYMYLEGRNPEDRRRGAFIAIGSAIFAVGLGAMSDVMRQENLPQSAPKPSAECICEEVNL